MVFTEKSALAKTWVRLIQSKAYTLEDVPNIGNLKEIVETVLNEE